MDDSMSDSEGLYDPPSPAVHAAAVSTSSDDYYLEEPSLNDSADAQETATSSTKRKIDPAVGDGDVAKRQKVVTTALTFGNLPKPVLQHAFSFLQPLDLIRCLQVNHHWRDSLTCFPDSLDDGGHSLQLRSGDEIWGMSRTNFMPGLPEPLKGVSELRMLALLLGKRCEQCDTLPTMPPAGTAVWNSGPGRDETRVGVRIIWHFAARLCGNCFENFTAKDVELIITSDKLLLPGLAHVMRTVDMNYAPPSLIQGKTSVPPSIQLAKVYYRPALRKLRQVHEGLPADVVEAWLGDLRNKGKRAMDDAIRWVSWESLLPAMSARKAVLDMVYARPAASQKAMVDTFVNPLAHNSIFYQHMAQSFAIPGQTSNSTPDNSTTLFGYPTDYTAYNHPAGYGHQYASVNAMYGQSSAPAPGTDRYKTKNSEIKQVIADRRAEIERRCMEEIDPPLFPNVLEHIPQFRAALQIPRPLKDEDWRVLKPRLLERRLEAEQAEHDRSRNFDSTQYVNSITQRTNRRAAPGTSAGGDPQKERQQKPVRHRLLEIAQDVITKRWAGSENLREHDCANFAADVIVTTMSRFRESTDPSEFEMGHAVTLESIKNLYDIRIKPTMDRLDHKEVFLCADCEDSSKWYTFDGMMQHFGAKHEPDFGTGNVVVAWQIAEWPEDPPFRPHPVRSRRVPPAYAEVATLGLGLSTHEVERYDPLPVSHYDRPTPSPDALLSAASGYGAPSFLSSLRQPPQPIVDDASPGEDPNQSDDEYEPELVQNIPQPVISQRPVVRSESLHSVTPEVAASKHASDNPALKAFQAPPQTAGVEPRDQVAKSSVELLKTTGGLPDLADSVRLYVIIHHIDVRYSARFNKQLTIEVFRESLASRTDMKSFKKWKNLICNTCAELAKSGNGVVSKDLLSNGEKRHSLGSLLVHFQSAHSGRNFLTDMLELPDLTTLRTLPYITGMTDAKLSLISSALPESVFPAGVPRAQPPQPSLAIVSPSELPFTATLASRSGDQHVQVDGPDDGLLVIKDVRVPHAQRSILRGHGRNVSGYETELSMPEAAEDEYDPRRPSMPEPRSDQDSDVVTNSLRTSRRIRKRHTTLENVGSGKNTDDQGESIKSRRRVSRKNERAHGRPGEDFFDYRAVEIPDVIRTEYNPETANTQDHQTSPALHQRSTSISSAHKQPASTGSPRSPPRYFDQYGNPVILEHLTYSMPSHQPLTVPGQMAWPQPGSGMSPGQLYESGSQQLAIPGYAQAYAQPQHAYAYAPPFTAPPHYQLQPAYPHHVVPYGGAPPPSAAPPPPHQLSSGSQPHQTSSMFGPGGVEYIWDDSD